jgi:hypothetical protein
MLCTVFAYNYSMLALTGPSAAKPFSLRPCLPLFSGFAASAGFQPYASCFLLTLASVILVHAFRYGNPVIRLFQPVFAFCWRGFSPYVRIDVL